MAIPPSERVSFLLGYVLNDLYRTDLEALATVDAFIQIETGVIVHYMNSIMLTSLFALFTCNATGGADLTGVTSGSVELHFT